IVGVIFSRADFDRAIRMRNPPDFFELRLDALAGNIESVRNRVGKLPSPLIVTARHPQEGGANHLSPRTRRELFLAFLPHATWIDIELRSARAMAPVLQAARARNIRLIISFHDFRGTPSAARLDQIARKAQSLGPSSVKIVTRTDTSQELKRLLDFFERSQRAQNVVVMGLGKLGRASRLELARRGCALNYAHLGTARVAGQLSVPELRRALR
ncbi:MAG TPA: type I 3-dehydroquinate dehydratase, partial [Chthoniobacterales bacterium]